MIETAVDVPNVLGNLVGFVSNLKYELGVW